jgi:hypothetical protein
MRITLITIAAFIFLSSCSILFPVEEHSYYKRKVHLLDENEFKKEIIFSIYTNYIYELQVPLYKLIKYVDITDEKMQKEFTKFIDSILDNNTFDCKIESPLIKLEYSISNKFNLSPEKLFESGDYMIYDTKSKTYINEVEIESDIHYRGPLNATYSYSVRFDWFFFWGYLNLS